MTLEKKNEIKFDITQNIDEDSGEFGLNETKKYLRKYNDLYNYFEEKGENCILVKLFKKYEAIEINLLINWIYSVRKVLKLKEFMMANFPEYTILEKLNLFIRVKLSSNYKLSQIFGQLHQNQEALNIEAVSYTHLTLPTVCSV